VDPAESVLPNVSFVRPVPHDTAGTSGLPEWVTDLGTRPVVYVTFGNIINREQLFRPFVDAFGGEPFDVVVTVGRSVDPARFEPLPDNLHVEQYIPNSLLLSRVDAVVCHGGFNTVMGALAFGRPLVLAPITADQPIHAQRCSDLGVGRVIDSDAMKPAEIRAATQSVLEEPSFGEAARRLQRDIAALPDIHATAAIVERAAANPAISSRSDSS
jgi:MGT family glycosyltransferase